MQKLKKPVLFMLLFSGIVLLIILAMQPFELVTFKKYISVLAPKGLIGLKERNLLLIVQAIMLLVVIPVYLFTFIFSWKYRADKKNLNYDPDLVDNKVAEFFWWGIPAVIIAIIGVLTYIKTDELDPYKPIVAEKPEKTIQVVALQWKWLFIYPEEKIASVNFFQIPVDTPIRFEITADAPMNSFWIPHLGGQIYAMPGMRTLLHLIGNEEGEYPGSSANLSGEGFANMTFKVKVSSDEEFADWVSKVKSSSEELNYKELVAPSQNAQTRTYRTGEGLFDAIIMRYMVPETK